MKLAVASIPRHTQIGDAYSDVPLVVDLDGTLICTDSLHELFASALFSRPAEAVGALWSLLGGRNKFKSTVSTLTAIDASTLPYREDVLAFLRSEHASGRRIYLITAAHQTIATAVADYLRLFIEAKGSDENVNLKGPTKLEWIEAELGPVFDYVGDSSADLPIWAKSRICFVASSSKRLTAKLRATGANIGRVFDSPASLRYWVKALRLHQASKNALVFVPLILSHKFVELGSVTKSLIAFALMTVVSSATYLINDLADLAADRAHATKRNRPLASGRMPVAAAAFVALFAIAAGVSAAAAVTPILALTLAGYLAVTLGYSFRMKRVPLLDIFVIATLFTMRIIIGTAVIAAPWSPWLLPFALIFFFSLALAKRHAEIIKFAHKDKHVAGRGYSSDDWPLTLTFGVGSAMTAMVIMLLYMTNEAGNSGLYHTPTWLYGIPVAVFLWILRIWFFAHRGILTDDPVIFALRDRVSWLLALAAGASFALAI
jgi:4-hydroxybenzoate polyprenyltransferase